MPNLEELNEKLNLIRPFLEQDQGGVDVVEYTNNVLTIKLLGSCQSCNIKESTIKLGIENVLKQFYPDIVVKEALA